MSEQTNYPKRGQMSEDGRIYTHIDGTVNECVDFTACRECALNNYRLTVNCYGINCGCSMFKRIEGAYVPSDCEIEACEMARAQIEFCSTDIDCELCGHFETRLCPARKYLAAHGDARAWEVK